MYPTVPHSAIISKDGQREEKEPTIPNAPLKEAVFRLLPRVKAPAQYSGGELNSVVKDHRRVRGRMCLCFPDAYSIGTSHHGLQVLYPLMNGDPQGARERAL